MIFTNEQQAYLFLRGTQAFLDMRQERKGNPWESPPDDSYTAPSVTGTVQLELIDAIRAFIEDNPGTLTDLNAAASLSGDDCKHLLDISVAFLNGSLPGNVHENMRAAGFVIKPGDEQDADPDEVRTQHRRLKNVGKNR